ncbi:MAG: addiction module protein [Pirellulales bacterium]|nr:addiction module protein [Pirellulales bacterium]
MSTPEEIFAAAQSLTPSDQWQLVTRLWNSLPDEAWEEPCQADLDEIQRRSAEFDAGGVATVSRDEVRRRIRERLADNG